MKTEVEQIHPAQAQKYLEHNLNNRRLREGAVRRFAREMECGRWYLHHQGIAFNDAGQLIDGQHRLKAIILSGKTIEMNVTRGIRDNGTVAAHFIDIGNVRSIGDQLSITTGMKNANNIVAAARIIGDICYADGGKFSQGGGANSYTIPIVQGILKHYEEQIQLVLMALSHSKLRPAGVVGAMAFCANAYPGVLRFAEGVGTGEMLEADSPELALRNWLLQPRQNKKIGRSELFEIVAGAARAYLDDKPLSKVARAPKALEYFRKKQQSVVEEVAKLLAFNKADPSAKKSKAGAR